MDNQLTFSLVAVRVPNNRVSKTYISMLHCYLHSPVSQPINTQRSLHRSQGHEIYAYWDAPGQITAIDKHISSNHDAEGNEAKNAPDRKVERRRIVESIDEEEIENMHCERLLN